MPSHPDRVRSEPLPEGYQFGQGWLYAEIAQRRVGCKHQIAMAEDDGAFCMNCGTLVSLEGREVARMHWNTIEPD
jgi:hypothetical protein